MAEAYMAGQKPFLPGEFLCTPSAFRETPHLKPAPVMELQDIPAMNSRFDGFGKLPETFRQKVAAQTLFEK